MKLKDRIEEIKQKLNRKIDEFVMLVRIIYQRLEEEFKIEEARKQRKWYTITFAEMYYGLKKKLGIDRSSNHGVHPSDSDNI